MSLGLLFALSLPGLVVLLVVLAAVERLGRFGGTRNLLPWRRGGDPAGAPLSGTGLEELHAMLSGAKRIEVQERATRSMLRDEDQTGAPPLPAGLRLDHGDRPQPPPY
ncbi:MAG TPA: DUF6191 domain-containing protein [Actinophytocola sp.]|uniref:DUF6191 domain-containing protein n=1 Tax=Actinophytocola sp. TaxID=1872138 RepID=UPI002DB5F273|nr:DUF6191 domain-containing protein [Actinophytocola sp.]HEU5472696.1 DUF6191 domain-containing protein [Actinophytocola sp.]